MTSPDTPSTSSIPNELGQSEALRTAKETLTEGRALADVDQVQRTIDTVTGQDVLAEFDRRQKSADAVVGQNYLATIEALQKSIDVAAGGALAEVQAHRKAMEAAMGGSAAAELAKMSKVMEIANGGALADVQAHKKAMEAAMGGSAAAQLAKMSKPMEIATRAGALAELARHRTGVEVGLGYQSPMIPSTPPVPRDRPRKAPAMTKEPSLNATGVLSSVADLGIVVRRKRKEMGLTQQQFADLTGVGRRFVLELEAGKPTLEFGRVLKVCQSIGIDLAVLFR